MKDGSRSWFDFFFLNSQIRLLFGKKKKHPQRAEANALVNSPGGPHTRQAALGTGRSLRSGPFSAPRTTGCAPGPAAAGLALAPKAAMLPSFCSVASSFPLVVDY